jgi:hypothetical protein
MTTYKVGDEVVFNISGSKQTATVIAVIALSPPKLLLGWKTKPTNHVHYWSVNAVDVGVLDPSTISLPAGYQYAYWVYDNCIVGLVNPPTAAPTSSPMAPTSASAPHTDPSWRTWRDQNRSPNECPCGIVKSLCTYHKE